jgi:hypothetical protein
MRCVAAMRCVAGMRRGACMEWVAGMERVAKSGGVASATDLPDTGLPVGVGHVLGTVPRWTAPEAR